MREVSDSRPADDGGATDSVKRSPINNALCVCVSGPKDGGGCSRTEVMCPPQVVRDPSEPPRQCSVSGSLNSALKATVQPPPPFISICSGHSRAALVGPSDRRYHSITARLSGAALISLDMEMGSVAADKAEPGLSLSSAPPSDSG
ncbi:hypothetical protein EYF80_059008 [Liparis tanakae]|uniref:Uncharacterized protein n=1 Tax=Liparis tanakae TaxID=230148 RepID=A0A4Z2EQJ7_9TELE|nr:hypothetical protein EYF80_059008 [Liparis tanakae]